MCKRESRFRVTSKFYFSNSRTYQEFDGILLEKFKDINSTIIYIK